MVNVLFMEPLTDEARSFSIKIAAPYSPGSGLEI